MSAESYSYVYIGLVIILTLIAGGKILSIKNSFGLIKTNVTLPIVHIVLIFLIFFLGFRPIHPIFGDTVIYRNLYNIPTAFEDDWLFGVFQRFSSQYFDVSVFFFLITVGYIVPIWASCKRIIKKNTDILVIFCISAMSFYVYAVNGIRNGLACSILLWAITYINGNKKEKLFFILLSIIAIGLHKSIFLPFVCAVFAYYYRKTHVMFYFWFVSIVISLIGGNSIGSFFGTLGFDDRMANNTSEESIAEYAHFFSSVGFRWDFLLYSFMPILLGWYTVFKRRYMDETYYILLSTYIYANSFWVMVIYAVSSNRFAYLSWFLYPIVLAYPLLKFPVFKKNHNQKTVLILFGHLLFTILMTNFY